MKGFLIQLQNKNNTFVARSKRTGKLIWAKEGDLFSKQSLERFIENGFISISGKKYPFSEIKETIYTTNVKL